MKSFSTYEFRSICSVEFSVSMNVDVINTLRRFESHVIITGIVVLPEIPHLRVEQRACFLTQSLSE